MKNNIGHYILGRAIGQGTFGKVRNGTHIITGERVGLSLFCLKIQLITFKKWMQNNKFNIGCS
jgi:hypothetical protein